MKYEYVMENWKAICGLLKVTEAAAWDALESGAYDDGSDEGSDLTAVWDYCETFNRIIAEKELEDVEED